jgi:hypothetical protein
MILRWDSGSTEKKPVPVGSIGGMILILDSVDTERETCPSTEHWRNDTEMGQWIY